MSISGLLALGLTLGVAPMGARAATVVVNPGDSIQAAVDAAQPGDTVRVMPGDYTETHGNAAAVRITKRLKLIAQEQPGRQGSPPARRRQPARHPDRAGEPG